MNYNRKDSNGGAIGFAIAIAAFILCGGLSL